MRVATWLTNLDTDWSSPIWRPWLTGLGEHFTVVRYDDRGSGMSDRHPADISFERWIEDLEAVVDSAGLSRFALLGMSQAGAVATAYAARNPARVDRLVLYGAYARGALRRNLTAAQQDEQDLFLRLMRIGWGRDNPAFERIFTSELIPDATDEEARWLGALQRGSTEGETAAAMALARAQLDVTDLARSVRVPTLILHLRDDQAVGFEEGRELAALIPEARFLPLEGRNHIILGDDPAWPVFVRELATFAGAPRDGAEVAGASGKVSARELEVIQAAAEGMSNQEIAVRMGISVRTIERHLANIYTKLGLSGKAARAAAVARMARLKA